MYRIKTIYKPVFFVIDMIGYLLFFWLALFRLPVRPTRIAIVRSDHIGDMIMTSSFIRNLKSAYPEAELTLFCRKMSGSTARMIPGVDKIITVNFPWMSRKDSSGISRIFRLLRRFFLGFDMVFDMHPDPRNILFSRLIGRYHVGFGIRGFGFLLNHRVRWSSGKMHMVRRYLSMLKSIGLKTDDGHLEIVPGKAMKKKVSGIVGNKDYVLVQLSAGSRAREWPLDYWVELIRSIVKYDYVVFAEKDKAKMSYITSHVKSKKLFHINLKTDEYITAIGISKLVISVESLAIHAASAFGVPVIDLHSAQTLKEEWGPFSKRSSVLQDRSCRYYPCGHDLCPLKEKNICMKMITPKKVYNEYQRLR